MLHKVSIAGMTMDPASNTPIIILKSEEDDRAIPIWIGLLEATAIASAIQNIKFDRPMTHDLFKNFVVSLDMSVSKIEVCDLKDNTFFAKIYFTSDLKKFSMDARPSDAIAIALGAEVPIFVEEDVLHRTKNAVLDKEGQDLPDRLKELIENLKPEDFEGKA